MEKAWRVLLKQSSFLSVTRKPSGLFALFGREHIHCDIMWQNGTICVRQYLAKSMKMTSHARSIAAFG